MFRFKELNTKKRFSNNNTIQVRNKSVALVFEIKPKKETFFKPTITYKNNFG